MAKREAKQLFRACLKNGVLEESRARLVVSRLVTDKPRSYIPVLTHFHKLVKFDASRRAARVEAPVPLEPGLQDRLRAGLGRVYGPGLDVQFLSNPALIGGLRVQVGSDVYDGSVQARLRALLESF
jgi:F-type H+-transporting ATPase subunit delta